MPHNKGEQYVMTQEELQLLHQIQLEILLEVKRICEKCGIRYCMVGGTALGAIRHEGFIPWDDDIDIGFLREEYERFRDACRAELDQSRFYFQDHRRTRGYRWGYGKLRRKNTAFVRVNQENLPYAQGVFVDIFPFDYVPDVYPLRVFHNWKCFLFRKAFWAPIGQGEAYGLEKIVYKCLSRIPDRWLYRQFNHFIKNTNQWTGKKVRILVLPTADKQYGYDIRWYLDLIEMPFEGHFFPIARNYDAYLTCKYNDYMLLPPAGQRKLPVLAKLKLIKDSQ